MLRGTTAHSVDISILEAELLGANACRLQSVQSFCQLLSKAKPNLATAENNPHVLQTLLAYALLQINKSLFPGQNTISM